MKANDNTRYIAKRTVIGSVPLFGGEAMTDEKLRAMANKQGVGMMAALPRPDQIVTVKFSKNDIVTAQDYPVPVLQHLLDGGRIEPYKKPLEAEIGEVYDDRSNMLTDDGELGAGGDPGGTTEVSVENADVNELADIASPDETGGFG